MLAYHYPPLGGVAVMRVLRFTRYLAEFGYRPVVVCVQPSARLGEPRDPALIGEIRPGVEVHRIPCLEPENFSNSWDQPGEKILRNLFKTFDFLLVPDDRALWIGPASSKLRSLAKATGASLLWATAQPFSSLVAATRASHATGLPLVVDFRDDWTSSNADFRRFEPGRQARQVAQEQAVLARASAVVTVTPGIVEALKQRSPHPDRVHFLPNGYDPEHFQEPSTERGHVLLHAGGIYQRRSPVVFLQALDRLRQRRPELLDGLVTRFAGRIDPDSQALLVGPSIECPGFLPHAQVRREMQQARVNLMILEQVSSANWLYSGKIFEYFGARRPILMLGPEQSPLADIVRESGLGRVADGANPESVALALEALLEAGELPGNDAFLQQFDARTQTGRLAALFDQVLG